MKILVPLDGSALAEAALPVAERLARPQSAEVILLTVGELPETSWHFSEEHEALRRIVDAPAERLKADDVAVGVRTDMGGDAAAAIVRVAEEEGVAQIVMSTHGRSGLSRWTHGSVADAVLRKSTVPVTLVRPGGENLDAQHALLATGDPHDVAAAALALQSSGASLSGEELTHLRSCIKQTPDRDRLPLVEAYLAALELPARAKAVAEFIEHGSAIEREGALASAEELDEEAIDDLQRLTTASSSEVRWVAFEAIKAIDGRAAIAPLVIGLQSDDVSVRWIASNGLTSIGQPALEPVLRALTTDEPTITFHRAASRVLRRLEVRGHEAEVGRLLRALSHATTVVQSPLLARELLDRLERQP